MGALRLTERQELDVSTLEAALELLALGCQFKLASALRRRRLEVATIVARKFLGAHAV